MVGIGLEAVVALEAAREVIERLGRQVDGRAARGAHGVVVGVAGEVRRHFGDAVLRALIPRSVKVSEAPSYGQSVITYDPGSRGALSYLDAAKEIAHRGAEIDAKEESK